MNRQIIPMRRAKGSDTTTIPPSVVRRPLHGDSPVAVTPVRKLEQQLRLDVEQLFSSVVEHEHASDRLEDELLELVDAVAAARRGRRSRTLQH